MSEGDIGVKIRRWVSTLMWLRHRRRRWKTSESGGLYSVAFNKKEENEWLAQIPCEHQATVKLVAKNHKERLKIIQKRTGQNYGFLLINEQIQI